MNLFHRLSSHFSRHPVIALTGTDIEQITAIANRISSRTEIEVLHNTLALYLPNASRLQDVLAASGYVVTSTGLGRLSVTGWRPTPGQALSVEEIDKRIDLLMKMRQQADAANHLTRKATE